MKKTIALTLGLLLTTGLFTACSGDQQTSTNGDKQYTIGIAQFGEHASLDNCREGFLQGLAEEGFVEGENLTVEYENAQFDTAITNQIAQKFVSKDMDIIAAIATPIAQSTFNAAKKTDIPVVFTAVTDPDAAMLTEGNITGTSDKLPVEAQLKLIRAMMPEAKNIGILYTTSEVNSESTIAEYKEKASDYGFEIIDSGISVAADIPLAVDKLLPQVDALTNLTDNTVVGSLPVILEKANARSIPVFGSEIEQVKLGCIASEGIEYISLGKQTGKMAAAILKGEKTAINTPYETIEESSLYINSEVMERLGLTLPEDMMKRAEDTVASH
ncbi:putative ABC transport system substrate-binding protein [Alkalibaculum bacchi]|mgnify:FL=1|uniref:Putative ABC transport system substrate-binding protein n=1 Tax=Alkalibaculum bacchi TaxID=645887 RepID=A0A366I8U8_9FIRM|nr:ABC transporter substrate-binding protein [Alkalibaculum bacchi]RBP65955.1 putative ABC transport system substrate-binding protein [Alkalibaculum bacchi]